MQNFKFSQEHSYGVIFIYCETLPEDYINSVQTHLKNTPLQEILVVCSYTLKQPWHDNSQNLEIVFLLTRHKDDLFINKISIDNKEKLYLKKDGFSYNIENKTITVNLDFPFYKVSKEEFFLESLEKFSFSLNEILLMEPVYIPKPWGQEIWYTGVEKRGVSNVATLRSKKLIPLPWFFSALPKTLLGAKYYNKNLVLIKILDPLPDEIYGDLYYELHTEKNEVYVVTHISSSVGKIKIGFNPEKIEFYKNNLAHLKKDFEESIQKYEIVRRKIDAIFDIYRKEESLALDAPVSVSKYKEWLQKIPSTLLEQEKNLREKMNEFSGYLNLQVGDVISVPILYPHALQHGVRVIEFQTPTYERLIMSFAQKVLTQNNWDTQQACKIMEIEEPKKLALKLCENNEHYRVEEVCSFSDFYSARVILHNQKEYLLKCLNFYQILFIVSGKAKILMGGNNAIILENQCVFIPSFSKVTLIAEGDTTFLICAPEYCLN